MSTHAKTEARASKVGCQQAHTPSATPLAQASATAWALAPAVPNAFATASAAACAWLFHLQKVALVGMRCGGAGSCELQVEVHKTY